MARTQAQKARHIALQRERYRANVTEEREKRRRANRRYKQKALDAYGRACTCCGETHFEFLAIDHIAGDGGTHRKHLFGDRNGSGQVFYHWLNKNGFPPGFRVLCANCNTALGHFGRCPHGMVQARGVTTTSDYENTTQLRLVM